MLVSIILVSYNSGESIFNAIQSILSQNYDKIELIISDDCSKYFDVDSISEFINNSKKNNIVNVHINSNNTNLGTVRNLNKAIGLSSGKIIMNLAADDLLHDDNVVSDVVEYFNINKDCLILTCKRDVYDSELANYVETLPTSKDIEVIKTATPLQLHKALAKRNFISGSSTVYTKKLFENFGLFSEEYKLLEDYPKYLQVTRRNVPINFFDRSIIKYRLGGISTGNKINPILEKDFINIYYNEIEPFKESGVFIRRISKWDSIKRQKKKMGLKEFISFPDVLVYKALKKLNLLGGE